MPFYIRQLQQKEELERSINASDFGAVAKLLLPGITICVENLSSFY